MSNNKNVRRVPLARYWTVRYLLALLVTLIVVSAISVTWIRHNTLMNRMDMLEVMADEMANSISETLSEKNTHASNNDYSNIFRERSKLRKVGIRPKIYIADTNGTIVSSNEAGSFSQQLIKLEENKKPAKIAPKAPSLFNGSLPKKVVHSKEDTMNFEMDSMKYYAVKKGIRNKDNVVIGYVVLLESKPNLLHIDQEYTQIAVLIGSIALIGTVLIYLFSRRLSAPIQKVANAAKQIQEGHYNVTLNDNAKEKEIYELIESFKEMARRLQQLEAIRTELLAGVTHELKTPVTSISGLLQAIQDGVVTDKDAKEFVKMALHETTKLKTMVGDLLAFNSFAVDAIPVHLTQYKINRYVQDSVFQWQMSQETSHLTIDVQPLDEEVDVLLDGVRFQQILTNLLTNANQAIERSGALTISLKNANKFIELHVKDTGKGIPYEEQSFIFERFYRGENKKYAVRGLGLGLPLSKMMAQSLNGDLKLLESSDLGTTFVLYLRK